MFRLFLLLGSAWILTSSTQAQTTYDPSLSAELVQAVDAGNLIKVRELLEKKADPNALNSDGYPLLFTSIWKSYQEISKALIEKGASSTAKNKDEDIAFFQAIKWKQPLLVHYMVKRGVDLKTYGAKSYIYSIETSQFNLAKWFVEQGISVNEPVRKDKATLLMVTVEKAPDLELVQWLIAKGADPKATDVEGKTALDYAKLRNKKEIADYLSSLTTQPSGK
jgi:uncharacterized protein